MGQNIGLVKRAGEEKRMDSNNIHLRLRFKENYKDMDHIFRTRWSGQGCINKSIIISIVMQVPKQLNQEGI